MRSVTDIGTPKVCKARPKCTGPERGAVSTARLSRHLQPVQFRTPVFRCVSDIVFDPNRSHAYYAAVLRYEIEYLVFLQLGERFNLYGKHVNTGCGIIITKAAETVTYYV